MRALLIIFLCAFFAYALGLVISNNNEIGVNLLFSQAPAMNLGLLLIISIVLGVLIGILLALLMFKVLQNKWELTKLKKENHNLKQSLKTVNAEVDRLKLSPTDSLVAQTTANNSSSEVKTNTATDSKVSVDSK